MFTPVSEQKGQYEQEFRKGECSGIYTMMHLPETIIDETKLQIKSDQEAFNEGDEE